jgi:hypothetical protein
MIAHAMYRGRNPMFKGGKWNRKQRPFVVLAIYRYYMEHGGPRMYNGYTGMAYDAVQKATQ